MLSITWVLLREGEVFCVPSFFVVPNSNCCIRPMYFSVLFLLVVFIFLDR